MSNNTYFKTGMTVYSPLYTIPGIVIDVHVNDVKWPITVSFNGRTELFTKEGYYTKEKEGVMLFQQPMPEMPVNVPLCEFSKGDLVWVSDNNENWYINIFIKYTPEHTYPYRTTPNSELYAITGYRYCKKYQPN